MSRLPRQLLYSAIYVVVYFVLLIRQQANGIEKSIQILLGLVHDLAANWICGATYRCSTAI
jgi:xanthine/uracil permease